MKFVKWLVVSLLIVSMLACVAGCSDTPAESSEPASNTPATTTTTQPDDGKVTYTVYVKDEAGNLVDCGSNRIQACAGGTCVPTRVENGVATWRLEENDYEVYFSNLTSSPDMPVEGYTYTTTDKKFYFEDGETELTIVLKAIDEH